MSNQLFVVFDPLFLAQDGEGVWTWRGKTKEKAEGVGV